MKTTGRFLTGAVICATLALAVGCATAPTGEDSSGSAVELRIAAKALDSIAEYSITVTGPGMSQIGPRTFAGGQTVELTVPRGDARRFRFERRIGQVLSDTGSTVQDIRNAVEIVAVTLVAVPRLPLITAQPEDVSVNQGMTARFFVQASGSDLAYRWYRDGAVISGANTYDYELSPTAVTDSGAFFYCEVYNDAGSVFSDTARLYIVSQTLPPHILRQPDDVTVSPGSNVSFSVAASGAGLLYQWYRDGAPISGATDTVLFVTDVAQTDSGATFMCRVTNDSGSVDTREAMLHVTAGFSLLWHAVDNPGAVLQDAVVTPDLIVAVGGYGHIYTSPHAFPLTWTLQTSGVSSLLNAVCWTGAQFVAAGRYDVILTSPDAITWTRCTTGTDAWFNGIGWNGETFVAVGHGNVVASQDGTTWTSLSYPGQGGSDNLYNIQWITDRWFLTGVNRIMTTVDGQSWTDYSAPFKNGGEHNANGIINYHFANIVYTGTKYVLSFDATSARSVTFWSEDLLSWSTCEPPEHVQQAGVSTMVWTGTHFVTANWSASGVSPDAVTWTAYPMQSNGTSAYRSLIFTGTHLLAVGNGNTAWALWPQ